MPIVTVDPAKYTRRELTTAPPDGYLMVRPLPYGMKLSRQDRAMVMQMKVDPKKGRADTATFESYSEEVTASDFAYCIGEHNLENVDGTLVDFTNPLSLKLLDPRVGEEISSILNEINGDSDERAIEDFRRRHSISSETDQNTLSTVSS